MSFPNTIHGSDEEIFNTYAASVILPEHSNERYGGRGQKLELPDGRLYRFGLAGGTELAAAKLAQNIAADTNLDTLAVQTQAAIGDTKILFTQATTFFTEDEARGGYIAVESAAALGHCYRIKSHKATASGSTTCTANLADGVTVIETVETTEKVTPIYPIGHDAIIAPLTTPTGLLLGVNPVIIKTLEYGWFQTRGIGTVLVSGTEVTAEPLILSGTAGALMAREFEEATDADRARENVPTVAYVVEIAPTTDFGLVQFCLE